MPQHSRSPELYLLILLLQFGSLLLIGLLVLRAGPIPHLSKLLGDLSDGQTGGITFHLGAEFWAENEEGRSVGGGGGDVKYVIIYAIREALCATLMMVELFWSQKNKSESDYELTGVSWGHWGPWTSSSCLPWLGHSSSSLARSVPCPAWPSPQTCSSPWKTLSKNRKNLLIAQSVETPFGSIPCIWVAATSS